LHGHSQRMGLSRPSVTQQDAGLWNDPRWFQMDL
jgi:hypothetical protein